MFKEYFKKAKSIIVSPNDFFVSITHEKGFRKPFMFYATTVAITLFIYVSVVFVSKNFNLDPVLYYFKNVSFLKDLNPALIFLMYWVLGVTASSGAVFVNVFFINLVFGLWRGYNRYQDVYRVYVYSTLVLSLNLISEMVLFFSDQPIAHTFSVIFSLACILWFLTLFIKGLKTLR